MFTELSVKNLLSITAPYSLLGILACTAGYSIPASAAEWPVWQAVNNDAKLTFDNGDTVLLQAAIHSLNPAGLGQTTPDVPGYSGDLPAHASLRSPLQFPTSIPNDTTLFELDFTNKTITPDTTVGLFDVADRAYKLSVRDINNNELPLTDVSLAQFNVLFNNTLFADLDIGLNRTNGLLSVSDDHDGGGNYGQSGLTLFTNLPPTTAFVSMLTTIDQTTSEGYMVFVGEGAAGTPGSGGTDPEPAQAHVNGGTLVLPVVTAGDLAYYVEFEIEPGSAPPVIVLTYAEELDNPDTTNAAFFDAGILTIVNVAFDGALWWGQFELISENPYRFRLLAADIDDEDDDNDGIPDSEDPAPYEPASSNDPAGIAGTWFLRFEIVSPVNGTACAGDEIVSFNEAVITYHTSTASYSISNGDYFGPLTVEGSSLSYSATYPEDGGTTSSSVSIEVQSPNSLSGFEIWTWTSEGEVPCVNIRSNITGSPGSR